MAERQAALMAQEEARVQEPLAVERQAAQEARVPEPLAVERQATQEAQEEARCCRPRSPWAD